MLASNFFEESEKEKREASKHPPAKAKGYYEEIPTDTILFKSSNYSYKQRSVSRHL